MSEPTVKVVRKLAGYTTFRVEGGEIPAEWARPGVTPWVEVTVRNEDLDKETVGCGLFGGEVWPAAYPALFVAHPFHRWYGLCVSLTEAGKAAFKEAFNG